MIFYPQLGGHPTGQPPNVPGFPDVAISSKSVLASSGVIHMLHYIHAQTYMHAAMDEKRLK